MKSVSFLGVIVSSCIAEFDLFKFICTNLIFFSFSTFSVLDMRGDVCTLGRLGTLGRSCTSHCTMPVSEKSLPVSGRRFSPHSTMPVSEKRFPGSGKRLPGRSAMSDRSEMHGTMPVSEKRFPSVRVWRTQAHTLAATCPCMQTRAS